ncbi:hypothetical protein TNCV_3756651 [Trichonephila clavipes]|nr:hypothetical protein TNCV_3756651 [Trichonephila clavipes]
MALSGSLPQINLGVQGKRRTWFLPDHRHTASLVGLRGGWRHARMKFFTRIYGSNAAVPGEMSRKSPFAVRKAIIGIGGEPKSIKKLRSGDLLIETTSVLQIAFPARSRHALLAKDLVTWQAMVGRHILEDIVGRVTQYVDEHYPVDKWHLGDLIAWVAQSALKYRPRICELSKCLEGPLKMIVCPKKLLPTLSHLVKLLYAARQ